MSEETQNIENNMQEPGSLKVIISGGGTGGHIYPAIAIANSLKEMVPDADILFVGAQGRMEMEKVPEAGYKIKGLWISGFQRSLSLKNLLFPFKLLYSMYAAKKIVTEFNPDIVVGVGGFASGPTLKAAQQNNIPTLIQEQNSYAGVTNKLLAEKVSSVCVAYEGMDKYFSSDKIIFTGNPVRKDILDLKDKKELAAEHFKLDPSKKTILVIGGSLGARTINESIDEGFDKIIYKGIQLIWQTGKTYYPIARKTDFRHQTNLVRIFEFIKQMDLAYAMADVVISRAGALSISELCLVRKPVILVPSPNVAEDHQTKNAQALVDREAAISIKDTDARESLVARALQLLNDEDRKVKLIKNIGKLGRPEAARSIAEQVLKSAGKPHLIKPVEEVKISEVKSTETSPVESKPQVINLKKQEEKEVESEVPKSVFTGQENFTHVYLIGVGGIGMSALARWFKAMGYEVAGYDKTTSELTKALESEGIEVHYDDNVKLVPTPFKIKDSTLIIYTPAIPDNMWELNYFRHNGFNVVKRSQVLGVISKGKYTIAIAGTHGKTTTSTMVAHLLHSAGKNNSAFLGGISSNFKTNLVIGSTEGPVVVEADEYDRSFLTLEPDLAIVTSTDADHLDIYENHAAVLDAFRQFIGKIKKGGTLIIKSGLNLKVRHGVNMLDYGTPDSKCRAENIRIVNGKFFFDYISPAVTITNLELEVPGYHNVENAVAAITVAMMQQVSAEQIREGLKQFKGVKRRFEYIIRSESQMFIDDYAHHPAEITALLTSAKALYPDKKVTIVFQPHLYSRTKDFAREFGKSLSLADEVILMEIYPAREAPIPGVTSELILNAVAHSSKRLCTKASLLTIIGELKPEILITAGAGDIDRFIEPIKDLLTGNKSL